MFQSECVEEKKKGGRKKKKVKGKQGKKGQVVAKFIPAGGPQPGGKSLMHAQKPHG